MPEAFGRKEGRAGGSAYNLFKRALNHACAPSGSTTAMEQAWDMLKGSFHIHFQE